MHRSSSGPGEGSSPASPHPDKSVATTPASSQPLLDFASTPEEGLDEDEVLRDSVANMVMNDKDTDEPPPPILADIPESECFLTSVLELRKEVQVEKHSRTFDYAYIHLDGVNFRCRLDRDLWGFQVCWYC
jgi:hypothetical protein